MGLNRLIGRVLPCLPAYILSQCLLLHVHTVATVRCGCLPP